MTDQRVAEYAEYYRARARRYAGNPLYADTAHAEAAMAAAVESCTSVEEMQQAVVAAGLNLECGRSLLRDQAKARAALYAETDEQVRAQFPAEVLGSVDSVADAAGLASLASSAAARNDAAVTADELHRQWVSNLVTVENVEVWRTATVPPRWRAELDRYAREAIEDARTAWAAASTHMQQHQSGWQFSEATARESRHRRLVPLPDEVFERRLVQAREIVGGA